MPALRSSEVESFLYLKDQGLFHIFNIYLFSGFVCGIVC